MTKMIEKDRRTPRYPAKPGTYVVYVEGTGAIRDLSMDGVFVLDSEPLPVGTSITFSLRTGAHDILLKGIVRSVGRGRNGDSVRRNVTGGKKTTEVIHSRAGLRLGRGFGACRTFPSGERLPADLELDQGRSIR